MPASSARCTARFCSAGSPSTINPPTAPHPNPSADTFSPVFPNSRCCTREMVLSRALSPGPRRLVGQLEGLGARVVDPKAARPVVGQRVRPIEAARVHPDAPRAARPGAFDTRAQEIATQSLADEPWQQAEVRHFDRVRRLRLELDV